MKDDKLLKLHEKAKKSGFKIPKDLFLKIFRKLLGKDPLKLAKLYDETVDELNKVRQQLIDLHKKFRSDFRSDSEWADYLTQIDKAKERLNELKSEKERLEKLKDKKFVLDPLKLTLFVFALTIAIALIYIIVKKKKGKQK